MDFWTFCWYCFGFLGVLLVGILGMWLLLAILGGICYRAAIWTENMGERKRSASLVDVVRLRKPMTEDQEKELEEILRELTEIGQKVQVCCDNPDGSKVWIVLDPENMEYDELDNPQPGVLTWPPESLN